MSNLTDIHPKIFISYTWANNNTTNFVLHLSERLSAHGVEVILDRWSLNNQTKFIPILLERDDNGNDYLPAYIKSRLYVDFSNENDYESAYKKLLRRLYDKPSYKQPPLGKPPAWLEEDSMNYNELNILVKKIENLKENVLYKFQGLKINFTETLIKILNDLRFLNDKFDAESLLKKIDSLKPTIFLFGNLLLELSRFYGNTSNTLQFMI